MVDHAEPLSCGEAQPASAGIRARRSDPAREGCEIRERLVARGTRALTDAELLALVVPGRKGARKIQSVRNLLHACGGGPGLLDCDFEIARAQGLTEAQAGAVLAAIELGRRLIPVPKDSPPLVDPAEVAHYLFAKYARVHQEVFGALYLDVHQRMLAEREFFRGDQKSVYVEPRPIVREALRLGACGIVLFHNHPSLDATPSQGDFTVTAEIKEACEALDLQLLDSLILAGERFTSLRWMWPFLLSQYGSRASK